MDWGLRRELRRPLQVRWEGIPKNQFVWLPTWRRVSRQYLQWKLEVFTGRCHCQGEHILWNHPSFCQLCKLVLKKLFKRAPLVGPFVKLPSLPLRETLIRQTSIRKSPCDWVRGPMLTSSHRTLSKDRHSVLTSWGSAGACCRASCACGACGGGGCSGCGGCRCRCRCRCRGGCRCRCRCRCRGGCGCGCCGSSCGCGSCSSHCCHGDVIHCYVTAPSISSNTNETHRWCTWDSQRFAQPHITLGTWYFPKCGKLTPCGCGLHINLQRTHVCTFHMVLEGKIISHCWVQCWALQDRHLSRTSTSVSRFRNDGVSAAFWKKTVKPKMKPSLYIKKEGWSKTFRLLFFLQFQNPSLGNFENDAS